MGRVSLPDKVDIVQLLDTFVGERDLLIQFESFVIEKFLLTDPAEDEWWKGSKRD